MLVADYQMCYKMFPAGQVRGIATVARQRLNVSSR